VFRRFTEVVHLHVGGRVIRTTDEHPFYAHGRGWVPVADLAAGDCLLTEAGDWQRVEEVYRTGDLEAVYNLRVAEHHTYFVGDADWGWAAWAHNSFCHLSGADLSRENLGHTYALLAQQAFSNIPAISRKATVAVTEATIDGQRKYVFAVYGPTGAMRALEDFASAMGAEAFHAHGPHAEVYLHQNYAQAPGFTQVIGHSNYNGTCPTCREYFQGVGFFNVWWVTDRA
jgi:hypothetical protein